MIPLTIEEVRALAPGQLDARADRITGVSIDSRRISPGDLFVAVGGGVAFLAEALERGAAATLVPEDAHAALADLARLVRGRSRARVVGITGSTGKTSTKDILAALCRPVARTVAAERGHNNEIGLPLTLLGIEEDTEVVVAEMGMRGLGQIAALCSVARPHVGVITGVGPVHLELLGTVERVAQAKAEVVDGLRPGGTAVVPARAPELEPFLTRTDVELVRFGPGGDVTLERFHPGGVSGSEPLSLLLADVAGERVQLEVPFTARHQAENTLAALAAYRALDLPLERAAEGARSIAFAPWRGEEHELPGGGLLVNDAYNANPVSMVAALRHLVERANGRRRVALLGEMAELGPDGPAYHRAVGAAARELGIEVVAVGGELARAYGGTHVEDADAAAALVRPGDAVLVKASRAAGFERVAEHLRAAVV